MYVVYFDSDVIKNCFVPSRVIIVELNFFFCFSAKKLQFRVTKNFAAMLNVINFTIIVTMWNLRSIINCDEKCDDEFEWPSTHFWHLKLKQFEYSSKYYFYVGNSSRFYSLNKFFLKSFHMLDSIIFENRFFVWRKRDKVSHEKKVSMINTPFQSFRKYL